MTKRDLEILKHVGRYTVSIRAVIEKLFFAGRSCDHVLNRLVEGEKLQVRNGLPGGLSYYQLSLPEARSLSIPEHRSRPRRSRGLREALAVLWFCCMDERQRTRIERRHLKKDLGDGRGYGRPHSVEMEGDYPIVRRLYVPGPNSRDKHLLKSIRIDFDQAQANEKLTEWVEDGVFRFTILVETRKRAERLRERINKNGLGHIPIDIRVVPGPMVLARRIKEGSAKC